MKNVLILLLFIVSNFSVVCAANIPPKLAVYKVDTKVLALDEANELSRFISSEVAKYSNYQVVSWAETGKIMGFMVERQNLQSALAADRDSLTLDDSAYARLGKSLGVDYMLATGVSKIGDRYLVNLSLNSMQEAKSIKSVSSQVRGNLGNILDTIPPMVAILMGQKSLSEIPKLQAPAESRQVRPMTFQTPEFRNKLRSWSAFAGVVSLVGALAANSAGDIAYKRYSNATNLQDIGSYRSKMQDYKDLTTISLVALSLSGCVFLYSF